MASLFLLIIGSALVSSVQQDQVSGSLPRYIQIDHNLVPKNISNIQIVDEENERKKCTHHQRTWWQNVYAKYVKENSGVIIQDYVKLLGGKKNTDVDEEDILSKDLEKVLGTDVPNVYYDEDWGLFSAVLASYNNHWVLSTGPEDWWTVVLRNVAQAVADHGDIPKVRDLFVAHQGKKEISIDVGGSLGNIDYSWLFDQFSGAIRNNIKVANYVDVIESDFSSTTPDQKIISQVMLMSSLKKYFSFGYATGCGIPGVYMKGTQADWEKLQQKLNDLELILEPVKEELKLKWFDEAKRVFNNLLKTFNGDEDNYRYCEPVKEELKLNWFDEAKRVFNNLLKTFNGDEDNYSYCHEPRHGLTMAGWWRKILSWKEDNRSGFHSHWEGWFPKFLGANNGQPYNADDFPSGLVTVAVNIADKNNSPPVEDKGVFVSGTLGFTVRESEKQQGGHIVEPNQIWNLLLPKCSPVTPRLKGITPDPKCTL